jgi:ribosomal protein S21
MIEVRRGEGESSVNLIKRFTKRVKDSGVLPLVRESRFKNRPKSKLKKKKEALKRVEHRKEREHLRKLGKIE